MTYFSQIKAILTKKYLKSTCVIFLVLSVTGFWVSQRVKESKTLQLTKISEVYSKYLMEKVSSGEALKAQILLDLHHFWKYQNHLTFAEWKSYVTSISANHPSIKAIGWVDSNGYLKWRHSDKPIRSSLNSKKEKSVFHDQLIQSKEMVVSEFRTFKSGIYGYAMMMPLWDKDKYNGFYYISLDAYTFLGELAKSDHFELEMYENNKTVFATSMSHAITRYSYNYKFDRYNRPLTIKVYPTHQLLASLSVVNSNLILLISFAISFLVAGLYYFLRQSREREKIISDQASKLANASKLMSLGEMASGIAHEINNPLSILSGKIHLIKRELGSQINPVVLTRLDRMDQIVFRIAKIISSLKKLSYKVNDTQLEVVSLKSIVDDVLGVYKEKFKSDSVTLHVDPIPNVILDCHPVEISQILSNLLSNSYDAVITLDEKWIRLTFQYENQNLKISVVDSGMGIPQNIQAKILQPFFTTKPVGMGMGIGLSISNSLAKHNNGDLYLDKKSQNTKFTLELKAKEPLQREF